MAPIEGEIVAKKKESHGGPRKGAGRPPAGRNDATARLDRAVVSQAKAVAQYLGISVAEVLTEAAKANVARQYVKMLRDNEGKDQK